MRYRQQPRDLTDQDIKMKSNEHRACVDCRWFARGDDGLTCTNPFYKQFDPVHGWVAQQAQLVRTTGLCGPSGKGWEEHRYVPNVWLRYVKATIVIGILTYMIGLITGIFK